MRLLATFTALALLSAAGSSAAETSGAMLRLNCSDTSDGATIMIDGKFKGECPVDIELRAGMHVIEASKIVGDYERRFRKELQMADGTVKRLDIVLGEQVLTPQGQQRAADRERIKAEQVQREQDEQRQREAEAVAMVVRADELREGRGVPADSAAALALYHQAAKAGNQVAKYKAHILENRGGKNYSFNNTALKILSLGQPSLRKVNITGKAESQNFLMTDPFFRVPEVALSEKFNFTVIQNAIMSKKICFVRNGTRYCEVRFDDKQYFENSRLGGILVYETWGDNSGDIEPAGVSQIFGTPFPFVANKVFGYNFTRRFAGNPQEIEVRCEWRRELNSTGNPVVDCLNFDQKKYWVRVAVWKPEPGIFLEVHFLFD